MKLNKLFKRLKQKNKSSGISQILEGEAVEIDDPFVIYLAIEIVSDYGEVLEQTSNFIWGVSEERLLNSKKEIESAIIVLLKFFQNTESWNRFKKLYPEISKTIFTNKFYGAIRCGYLELAKFVNDDDGRICEKAIKVISKKEFSEEDIQKLESIGFYRAVEINQEISSETHSRLLYVQKNFGMEDVHPFLV